MNLKEQITADIENVFLNVDEFGEYHRIEGKKVLVIVDTDKLAEISLNSKMKGQILDLSEADLLITGKTEDLPKSLDAGASVNYDGREMIVKYSSSSMVCISSNNTVFSCPRKCCIYSVLCFFPNSISSLHRSFLICSGS